MTITTIERMKARLQAEKQEVKVIEESKEVLELDNELVDYKLIDEITEDSNLRGYLKEKTHKLLLVQTNGILEIGKLLIEVKEEIGKQGSPEGIYEKWIELNGMKKTTAFRYRKRYELFSVVNSERKGFVATLPVRIIEEIAKREDNDIYIKIINKGTTKEELENLLLEKEEEKVKTLSNVQERTDFEIMNKILLFQNIREEDLKNIDKEKKMKIDSYLKKIEQLLKR